MPKNGYKQVELTDTNIKKESPPLFLESIVKKISQEKDLCQQKEGLCQQKKDL